MKWSETSTNLVKALVAVQKELPTAKKQSENPFYKHNGRAHRYADLAEVWDAARSLLTANGIATIQGASSDGKTVAVTTRLIHESGEWVEETLVLNPRPEKPKDGNGNVIRDAEPFVTPQAVGGAVTYGRRYGLASLVMVVSEDEDDDGESAMGRSTATGRVQGDGKNGSGNGRPEDAGKNGSGKDRGAAKREQPAAAQSGAAPAAEGTATEKTALQKHRESMEGNAVLYPVPDGLDELKVRAWLMDRIKEQLLARFPGKSKRDADGRLQMIQNAFGVNGWPSLETLQMTELRRGMAILEPPVQAGGNGNGDGTPAVGGVQ